MTGGADEEDVLAVMRAELAQINGDALGLSEHQAAELALLVTDWFRERFRGREIYVRGRSRQKRDREIIA